MDPLRKIFVLLTALLGALLAPSCGGGGGGGGGVSISATNSGLSVDVDFGTLANGTDTVTVTVTVRDTAGNAVSGQTVQIASTGTGNTVTQPVGTTDVDGVATGTIASTFAEVKTVSAVVNPGASQVALAGTADTEFVWHLPATFYVRKTGSDANAGDSPAAAWATIGYAVSQLVPGDTLYVGAGTYNESVTMTTSGTANDPILLLADVAGDFTDDPGPVIVDAGGGNFALHLRGVNQVAVRGFTVTGATPGASSGGGLWTDAGGTGCDSLFLSGIIAYGNDRGLHIEDTTNSYVESCRVSNNLGGDGAGMMLSNTDNVIVRNNLIYNNAGFGLDLAANNSLMLSQVNTFYANGDDQVHFGSACFGVVEDSILADGLGDGFESPSFPTSLLVENNNILWNHAGFDFREDAATDRPLDGTDQTVDPLLVDPDGGDNLLGGAEGDDDLFLVGISSASIDAGDANASTFALSFEGPLTGFTTRSDGTLDGTSPDGPLVNLGQHVPADVTPIGTLDSGDARLFYGSGDDVQVLARIWDENTSTWLPPALNDPVAGTVKWVISRVSPLFRQAELLAILSDKGTATDLSVRVWNGRFWSEAGGFSDPIVSNIQSANVNQRGFDIEYEDVSGDALVVYSNDDNNPLYRAFSQGVWTPAAPVFTTPPGAGTILWVELAARPGTDEIALVCLSETTPPDQGDIVAVIWDGDSWNEAGSAALLDTTIATTRESRAFDVAYEEQSGDLLVVWGHTNLIEEVRYAVRPAGSSAYTIADVNSAEAIGAIVRLAPEPGSSRILCALSEGSLDNDTVGMIWDGSAFVDIAEFDLTAAADARDVEVSWVGTSGVGIYVYKDDDGGGTLDWARYTGTGWSVQPDQTLPGIGDLEFIQMQSYEDQDKVMVLMSDSTGGLFALTYDGISWTITNSGAALETSLPDLGAASQPFHFALKK